MNEIVCFFTAIGFMAAIFGSTWLLMNALDYFFEVRRTLRECREVLRRLDTKR